MMLCGRLAVCAFLETSRQRLLGLTVAGRASAAAAAVGRPNHPHFHHPAQQQARRSIMAAATASDDDVRVTLRKLLPTVDMDTTSERKARHRQTVQLPPATSAAWTPPPETGTLVGGHGLTFIHRPLCA